MYRNVFLFLFFYIVNLNPVLSQVKMLPANILQINSSSDLEFDFSFLDHASIYFITEKNLDTVELKYLGLSITVMDLYFLTAYQEQSLQFDLHQQKVIENTEITRNTFLKSGLLHTDTGAIVNGVTVELERSSYVEEIECFDSGPRLYDRFCNISSKLKLASLSPNQQFIGGALHYTAISGGSRSSSSYIWDTAALWNANTGENLFYEFPDFNSISGSDADEVIDIRFSNDNKFMIFRSVDYSYLPRSILVNTRTFLEWEADKDVAFTPDSRFFVTERNGEPTLVDTQHNRNLQVYDIGASIMHAATFSEDGETLYIATGDDKIYVFPSQLPTSHVEDWELYVKAE